MKIQPLLAELLLSEALEHQFKEKDTIVIDPDRDDSHDIVNKLMPTLIRMAYTHLVIDQVSHEKRHGPKSDDEDAYNFEFTKSELRDRISTLIDHVREKLDDITDSELDEDISRMEHEFKTPLEKADK